MANIWDLLYRRNNAALQGTPTAEALLNSLIEQSNPGLSTTIFQQLGAGLQNYGQNIQVGPDLGSGGLAGAIGRRLPEGSAAQSLFGTGDAPPTPVAPLPAGKPNSWQLPASAGTTGNASTTFNARDPLERYISKVWGVEGTGKAKTSSAEGFGGFTEGTWIEQAARHGTPEQQQLAAEAIAGNKDARAALLALRHDQETARKFGRTFTLENREIIGGEPTEGRLYLAHFLGAHDAAKVLKANPNDPVENYVSPASIEANKSILQGKTVGEVRAWADAKMGAANLPSSFPTPPSLQPTNYPDAPTLAPQVAADPSAMLAELAKARPDAPIQNSGIDRFLGVLGGLAAGASKGGRSIGDVLSAAGAGAMGQVSSMNQQDTERQQRAQDLLRAFHAQMAQGQMTAAQLGAQGTNYGVQAQNQNAENAFRVGTARAENVAQVGNKNAENQYEMLQKKYVMGQPKISVGEDGKISVVTTNPDTQDTTVKQFGTGATDLAAITKLAEQEGKLDKVNAGAPAKAQIYSALAAKGGQPLVAQTMLGFAVEQGALKDILGDKAYKELEKAVLSKVPPTEQLGEAGQEKLKDARKAEVMRLYNERKISDEALVKAMAVRGDPAALAILSANR